MKGYISGSIHRETYERVNRWDGPNKPISSFDFITIIEQTKDINSLIELLNELKTNGFTHVDSELIGLRFLSEKEHVEIQIQEENKKHLSVMQDLKNRLLNTKYENRS